MNRYMCPRRHETAEHRMMPPQRKDCREFGLLSMNLACAGAVAPTLFYASSSVRRSSWKSGSLRSSVVLLVSQLHSSILRTPQVIGEEVLLSQLEASVHPSGLATQLSEQQRTCQWTSQTQWKRTSVTPSRGASMAYSWQRVYCWK